MADQPNSHRGRSAEEDRSLIDISYRANATGTTPPPALATIRARLVERFPQTVPIFA